MDNDDDEYDGSKHASVDEDNLWSGGRKSSRLVKKKKLIIMKKLLLIDI